MISISFILSFLSLPLTILYIIILYK
jgi:hypothetical protein